MSWVASVLVLLALNFTVLAHPPLADRICAQAKQILALENWHEQISRFATDGEIKEFKRLVNYDSSRIAAIARIENPVYKELNDSILKDLKENDRFEALWRQILLKHLNDDILLRSTAVLTTPEGWGLYSGHKDAMIMFTQMNSTIRANYEVQFQKAVIEYYEAASELMKAEKYAGARARMANARSLAKSFGTHHLSAVVERGPSKLGVSAWDMVSLANMLTREARATIGTASKAQVDIVPEVMADSPENIALLYGRMQSLQKAYHALYETFPQYFPRGYRNQFRGEPNFSAKKQFPPIISDGVLHPKLNAILRKIPKQDKSTYLAAIAKECVRRTGKVLSPDLRELLEKYYTSDELTRSITHNSVADALAKEIGTKGVEAFEKIEADARFLKLKYIKDQIGIEFGDGFTIEQVKVIADFFTETDRWDPPMIFDERVELDFTSLVHPHLVADFGGFGARNATALQTRLREAITTQNYGNRNEDLNFGDLLKTMRLARGAEVAVTKDLAQLRDILTNVAVESGLIGITRLAKDPLSRQATGDDLILYPDGPVGNSPPIEPKAFHKYYLAVSKAVLRDFDGDFDVANLRFMPSFGQGNSAYAQFGAKVEKDFRDVLLGRLLGSDYHAGTEARKLMISIELHPDPKGGPGRVDIVLTSPTEANLAPSAKKEMIKKAREAFDRFDLGGWSRGQLIENFE